MSYIRADETPHVEYLRTVLSEMRDRTVVGESGRTIRRHEDDRPAVGRRRRTVAGSRRDESLEMTWGEVPTPWPAGPMAGDLLEQFTRSGSMRRRADGNLGAGGQGRLTLSAGPTRPETRRRPKSLLSPP